jgi:hypothetical protein
LLPAGLKPRGLPVLFEHARKGVVAEGLACARARAGTHWLQGFNG